MHIIMLSRLRGINWFLGQSLRLLGTVPKKLPAALQDCQTISGMYIDKTLHLATLFDTGYKRVLFTLPRRFGKTTYVDLVEQLCKDKSDFEETELGQTDFFKTWPENVPCIKLNFQSGISDLKKFILSSIIGQARAAEVPLNLNFMCVGGILRSLLDGLYAKKKQDVVVLIDEYDAPLNTLDKVDRETNTEVLTDFFGALKSFKHMKLLMVIGTVNRFELLSSRVNDIIDVTQNKSYAKMFGFTREEVENKVFPPQDTAFYNGLDFEQNQTTISAAINYQRQKLIAQNEATKEGSTESPKTSPPVVNGEVRPVQIIVPPTVPEKRELFLQQIKEFYNGYLFSTEKGYEPMYNPFSILRCKNEAGLIDCYWADRYFLRQMNTFITRFPHLMDQDAVITIKKNLYDAKICGQFLYIEDVESLLHLWTNGFLTIHKFKNDTYTLVPTNGEVITAYNSQVLKTLRPKVFAPQLEEFMEYATEKKFEGLLKTIDVVLRSELNRVVVESDITSTLTYLCSLTNGRVQGIREVRVTNMKGTNIVLKAGKYVYAIENKIKKMTDEVSSQIVDMKNCAYALEKFVKPDNCEIYTIGLNYAHNEGVRATVNRATLLPDGKIKYTEVYSYGLS